MSTVVNVQQNLGINVTDGKTVVNVGYPQNVTLDIAAMQPSINVEDKPLTLDVQGNLGGSIGTEITLVAGQNLSALRAVTTNGSGDAVYASNTSLSNALVVGITKTATAIASQVQIVPSGLLVDLFWNWTKGPVFLGTNGMLTQTAPTSGAIVVQIGRAITPTHLQVDIDTTILTV